MAELGCRMRVWASFSALDPASVAENSPIFLLCFQRAEASLTRFVHAQPQSNNSLGNHVAGVSSFGVKERETEEEDRTSERASGALESDFLSSLIPSFSAL